MNSAHLFIDVHFSSETKKIDLAPLLKHIFCDVRVKKYQYSNL